ncbi:MAG: class I SAM-dependent methyltransferase, partial [Caulobacteraceae bacterium]|nr:class I SAM-dependent methyltransferase [Caulobacteraceae bacterium]
MSANTHQTQAACRGLRAAAPGLRELVTRVSRLQEENRTLARQLGYLEVGAGGGSVAAWLADRVGPTGAVLATDQRIDPMAGVTAPNLQVRVHDVVADPIDEAAYDLVHLRFVLQHLPDRAAVLRKLIAALRPGGWLLVEEADYGAFDASIGHMPAPVAAWYREVQHVLRDRLHIDNYAGRRLLDDLLATELAVTFPSNSDSPNNAISSSRSSAAGCRIRSDSSMGSPRSSMAAWWRRCLS